jgi:hypothetical protein
VAAISAVAALACAGTGGAPQALAVGPLAPAPVLTPASVDFGSFQVGESSDPVTVTLSNNGAGNLTFWRFGIASASANPNDFRIVAGGSCNLSLTLATGESCTVLVRFKPTDTGSRNGLLSFWVNTPTGRIDAALTGYVDDPCAMGCF